MYRLLAIVFILLGNCYNVSAQQVKMRDVFAQAPDSIFPLMTKNNRLDCIDFIENNMRARVKNKFDTYSELLILTNDYLRLQPSERSTVEMKIFSDSLLCFVHTFQGPAADSEVYFYNLKWEPVSYPLERPKADDFFQPDADEEVSGLLRQLPLIKASLSPDSPTLTWELQTDELTKVQKKTAERILHSIAVRL
jgi:hypothetical protein